MARTKRTCPQCGVAVAQAAKFCNACGAAIAQPAAAPERRWRRRLAIGAGVLVVLCLGLAGLGALVDDPAEAEPTATFEVAILRPTGAPATLTPASGSSRSATSIASELVPITATVAAPPTATDPAASRELAPSTSVPSVPPTDTAIPTETAIPTATVPSGVAAGADVAYVVGAVDGDTVTLAIDGTEEAVQLAGIDAPEEGEPGDGGECFGAEATDRLRRTLPEGREVWVIRDGPNRARDGVLRYVWIVGDDGTASLVNESLVRRGFADVTAAGREGAFADRLLAAELRAQDDGEGAWAECGGAHEPLPTPTPVPSPTPRPTRTPRPTAVPPPPPTEPPAQPACDPNYVGACVPPYPPDVNCPSLPDNFGSVGSDPHRLDADNDGVACEA